MDLYDKIFKTNVRSVYLLTNLAIPHLIETKGNVVNVSSMLEAALDHFTRCTAYELASKKVRVNGINPGGVQTNLLHASGLDKKTVNYLMEKGGKFHPLGRIGTVDDTSEAIMFLASDKASFITGQSLFVDGGLGVNSPIIAK
ncbi:hypothetical protein MML48_4g00011447 [Holotrichia oblita]|uniref:Uncharacterized protein n=1 Tax=Holotrichia oblita TaxID=644536 RepID=A0ACB9T6J2_HOLOL|nr:hypothetical protein MML48_4g00011447 [Holotrichia oblita]